MLPDEPVNLPAVPDGAGVAEILDGEVVTAPDPAPRAYVLRPVVVAARAVTVAVRHDRTRAAARHAAYVPAGAVVLARRRRQGRTLAERMAQDLAARGETDKAALLLQQAAQERHRRHERRADTVKTAAELAVLLARNAHWLLIGAVILMLAFGIFLGDPAWPFHAAHAAAVDLRAAARWTWRIGIFAGPVIAVIVLHEAGRRSDLAPGWVMAAKQGEEERGLVVTADSIVLALQHLPGAELKKEFRNGWKPVFHTLPIRDGEGYFSVFSLPMGVTAGMIADQVEVFARNLHRAKCEVWVTDAERAKVAPAGYVALWVANPGVLDRPAPEYPLLHDGQADVFEGVPGGVVARGDGAMLPVAANNLVLGGQMGQGKSNGCRVYLLGCCTDPLCEVSAFVFANNGDFDAFAPRLATYVKGTDDATAAAAVEHLHALLDEVGRREGRLAELGAKKLTRRIAGQHPDMRPMVSLFSECHELFGHPEHGEMAAELAVKVIKRARKAGITLVFDTQSSRKGAIPPALVELVSVNGCFYVKSWRSNDGFLGDGSFAAGIRATELRPGRDRGRSLITGISDAQFELLKWYFVEVDDDTGFDAAAEVIARCMKTLAPGTRASGSAGAQLPVVTVRDLLDDLDAAVGGGERVKLRDALGLLRSVDPAYPAYRQMTAIQLREALLGEGVRTVNASGTHYLDPADLRRALAERSG